MQFWRARVWGLGFQVWGLGFGGFKIRAANLRTATRSQWSTSRLILSFDPSIESERDTPTLNPEP